MNLASLYLSCTTFSSGGQRRNISETGLKGLFTKFDYCRYCLRFILAVRLPANFCRCHIGTVSFLAAVPLGLWGGALQAAVTRLRNVRPFTFLPLFFQFPFTFLSLTFHFPFRTSYSSVLTIRVR